VWWHAWHLRNDSIFDDGKVSVDNSDHFLINYFNTTNLIEGGLNVIDRIRKGKGGS
jgi:hypothetical protein